MSHSIDEISVTKIKNKNLVVLYIINIIHGIGMGFFNSVYQPYLSETQSAFMVGVIQSTGFAALIVAMLVSSILSEKYGKKSMILIGSAIFMIGYAILYIGNEQRVFLITGSVLIWGGYGWIDPSWVGTIAQNTEKEKSGLVYGLIAFFFFGGSILGSFLVKLLEHNLVLELVGRGSAARFYFLVTAVILLLELLIQGFFLDDKSVTSRKPKERINSQKKIWRVYLENKSLLKLLGFFMLDAFVWGICFQLYATSLSKSEFGFGLSTGDYALYVVMVVNIGNVILQIPAGKLVDRIGSKKSLLISIISGFVYVILNIIMWGISRDYTFTILIFAQIAWTVVVVTFIPGQNKIISTVYPDRTTELYGFMNFARNILWFLAGYLAGWILETFGFIGPMIAGLVGVIGEIIYLFLLIDEKKLVNSTSSI